MKRLAVVALLVCVAVVAVAGIAASGGGSGDYRVRAIFDSAFAVIPGEDVKVAGVKVGTIQSLDVTPDKKAAIVLDISKPGFGDFRRDASCIIRPQSLIGERFVECTPTQERAPGQPAPPPLHRITQGPGKGEYLLPVTNTQRTVDIDLIGDIMRLPERQRLSIILNELGTGLAARGADLNAVIRRADPALMETDKVLDILRSQNRTLARLATNADTSLAPLANRRRQVADFVEQASRVATATAQRRGALEQQFAKLPPFLRQLRPTLHRLGALSDQMTPVFTNLRAQAPNINRFISQLGPLSQAALPFTQSLGEAAKVGTPAVQQVRPITRQVRDLAAASQPLAHDLAKLTTSVRDTGGIERAMDFLLYTTTATNGFDASGHYLRAALLFTKCTDYATQVNIGCEATFRKGASSASAASASVDTAPDLAKAPPAPSASSHDRALRLPSAVLPGNGGRDDQGSGTIPTASRGDGGTTTTTRTPAPTATTGSSTGRLLDYLLGDGS